MSIKWQTLILIILILVSVTVTKLYGISPSSENTSNNATTTASSNQQASLSDIEPVKKIPTRKWDVLDPKLSADVIIAHSLDDNLPFYYQNIRDAHVLASLTKLLTTIVVMEDIGLDKKIPVTKEAIETRGLAGDLKSGESYSARDLLKIMLLTSSNDAAAAFEKYVGGKEKMAKKINNKAIKLGLNSISVEDASGLCDYNMGEGIDFLKLTKYILKHHPEIFTWTQAHDIWVQPWNGANQRKVYNINPLSNNKSFLGGKTGTSKVAGENLVSVFNIENRRVVIILMGSQNRVEDSQKLISWIKKAYTFPEE